MEVAVTESTPHLGEGEERVYFCCEGCRAAFATR
jgi:xanthine dehydrogenase accessory factor